MTGYQEALTDPSFAAQILTFTAPMIGNYGVEQGVGESDDVQAAALVCRAARNAAPPGRTGLLDWLASSAVPAIEEIDTRALVRHLRERGAMLGAVVTDGTPLREAAERIAAAPQMAGQDLTGGRLAAASRAGRGRRGALPRDAHRLRRQGLHRTPPGRGRGARDGPAARRRAPRTCGPASPTASCSPTGRATPAPWTPTSARIASMLELERPLFGICLGHQLLARALGLETFKLRFGHRGANHPVLEQETGRVLVTSQNHGFAVAMPDGPAAVEVTHTSLYDGTVEGLRVPDRPVWSMQFHPEAAPGPHDARDALVSFVDRAAAASQEGRVVPRRDDLRKIALIGSGPIVIGQACEFDYSGVQALRVLREEGYETVLVNSNPATIMTDPGWADRTYIEPLDLEGVSSVLRRERPDALLPTLGGQTALNLAMALDEAGVLDELGIELIGASVEAIATAEDRQRFAACMASVGLRCARSEVAHDVDEARALVAAGTVRLPLVIRPAFTLGGQGGGFATTAEELDAVVARGVAASPISQVLVEESVKGWGEFELEVIRDRVDNVIVVCSIENLDPMGVHTGDSVCVAPAMTLSDREFQNLRDAAATVIRAVGVETGGSNVQFALDRETGELVVIEMNPRVSRSSALASKATGYPIAKVATKLALGYTLDEIPNDLTGTTPASFEPTLDYVVVKAPRFAFEKFAGADERLTTHMKSVGEAMSIGRTFCEAFGKAMRSRELDTLPRLDGPLDVPLWDRYDTLLARLGRGEEPASLAAESGVHPWFVDELGSMADALRGLAGRGVADLHAAAWRRLKRLGLADAWLAGALDADEGAVREARRAAGVLPVYKTVDSCAAEVEARTSYRYSTYEDETEPIDDDRPAVLHPRLGPEPHRPGAGVRLLLRARGGWRCGRLGHRGGRSANCNPETVSHGLLTSAIPARTSSR